MGSEYFIESNLMFHLVIKKLIINFSRSISSQKKLYAVDQLLLCLLF